MNLQNIITFTYLNEYSLVPSNETLQNMQNNDLEKSLLKFTGTPEEYEKLRTTCKQDRLHQTELNYFSSNHPVIHFSDEHISKIASIIQHVCTEKSEGNWLISRKVSKLPSKIFFHITKEIKQIFLVGGKTTHPYTSGANKIGRRVLLCTEIKQSSCTSSWATKEVWLLNNKKNNSEFFKNRELEYTFYTSHAIQHIFPKIILDSEQNTLVEERRYCFYERYVDLLYFSSHIKRTAECIFSICLQLVKHCNTLHKEGYILGDIKLNNALIDEKHQVFFCDMDTFTKDPNNFYGGTETYMAPERFKKRTHTVSSLQHADVFSLGCAIYELIYRTDVPWGVDEENGRMTSVKEYRQIYGNKSDTAIRYFSSKQAKINYDHRKDIYLKQLAWAAIHPNPKKRPTLDWMMNNLESKPIISKK